MRASMLMLQCACLPALTKRDRLLAFTSVVPVPGSPLDLLAQLDGPGYFDTSPQTCEKPQSVQLGEHVPLARTARLIRPNQLPTVDSSCIEKIDSDSLQCVTASIPIMLPDTGRWVNSLGTHPIIECDGYARNSLAFVCWPVDSRRTWLNPLDLCVMGL
jgi:hypothetical protein